MTRFIVYLDDIIILETESYENHHSKVVDVLRRLEKMGILVNAEKSFWAKPKVEYLGFLITREGIEPHEKNLRDTKYQGPHVKEAAKHVQLGVEGRRYKKNEENVVHKPTYIEITNDKVSEKLQL